MFKHSFTSDGPIAHVDKELKTKERSPSNHRSLIYSACAGIALLSIIIIIVAIVIAISHRPTVDDDFFVSDDTKTTINIPTGTDSTSDHQTRTVYEYDDDNNVISMKTYFEYSDSDAAATAYASLKDQPEFKNATLQGKFIIVTADDLNLKVSPLPTSANKPKLSKHTTALSPPRMIPK